MKKVGPCYCCWHICW